MLRISSTRFWSPTTYDASMERNLQRRLSLAWVPGAAFGQNTADPLNKGKSPQIRPTARLVALEEQQHHAGDRFALSRIPLLLPRGSREAAALKAHSAPFFAHP